MSRIFLALSFLAMTVGCTTPPDATTHNRNSKSGIYSSAEYHGLFLCIGHADTAKYVARKKLAGSTLEEVTSHFRSTSRPENVALAVSIAERVFSETSDPVFPYAVSFFSKCSTNVADVPEDRVFAARSCFTNSLIADYVHAAKAANSPKQTAYQTFGGLANASAVNSIVDRVYASSASRAAVVIEEWKTCMAPFVTKPS